MSATFKFLLIGRDGGGNGIGGTVVTVVIVMVVMVWYWWSCWHSDGGVSGSCYKGGS